MTQFFNVAALYKAIVSNDYQTSGTSTAGNTHNTNLVFQDPGNKKPTTPIPDKLNIPGLTVESADKPDKPETTNTTNAGKRPSKTSKMRSKVTDYPLMIKRNPAKGNDPYGSAQQIVGDEDGEVKVSVGEGDTIDKPGIIQVRDNTNGQVNAYQYAKISPEEIAAGRLKTGQEINKDQFKEGETYYYLLAAVDITHNRSIQKKDHVEVYKLSFFYDPENDTSHYDLVQHDGMDGSGQSSIDYDKRGV